jgi:hypothetical protein
MGPYQASLKGQTIGGLQWFITGIAIIWILNSVPQIITSAMATGGGVQSHPSRQITLLRQIAIYSSLMSAAVFFLSFPAGFLWVRKRTNSKAHEKRGTIRSGTTTLLLLLMFPIAIGIFALPIEPLLFNWFSDNIFILMMDVRGLLPPLIALVLAYSLTYGLNWNLSYLERKLHSNE